MMTGRPKKLNKNFLNATRDLGRHRRLTAFHRRPSVSKTTCWSASAIASGPESGCYHYWVLLLALRDRALGRRPRPTSIHGKRLTNFKRQPRGRLLVRRCRRRSSGAASAARAGMRPGMPSARKVRWDRDLTHPKPGTIRLAKLLNERNSNSLCGWDRRRLQPCISWHSPSTMTAQ
jgi:hypothetical protein